VVFGAVEARDIVEVVWVSLVAGVLVCFAYALVVFGTGRSSDARRNGSGAASFAFGALAAIALAACLAAVVFGIHIMVSKS
jgi:uncharacterized PurR-regulated membrane protein YhhQ (DUF165 family)